MTTSQKELLLKDLREEADTCRHKDVQDIEAANLLDRAIAFISAPSTEGKPEVWMPITRPGQVNVGNKLRFTIGDILHNRRVKRILYAGTDREEIIYNIGRNYYIITSMAIEGKSSQKNVEFLTNAAPATQPTQALADPQELTDERIDWIANTHCPTGVAYPHNVKCAIRSALEEFRSILTGKRTS